MNQAPIKTKSMAAIISMVVLLITAATILLPSYKPAPTIHWIIIRDLGSVHGAQDDNAYCTFSGGHGVPAYGGATDAYGMTYPLRCGNSLRSNRPSPGSTITVASGGNLQTALNSVTCGQTIALAQGATYTSAAFTLPAGLNCDVNHWITITTQGWISTNGPPEGTRVTPGWNGISSLPNRPAYNTPGTVAQYMAIIRNTSQNGAGPFRFDTNANAFVEVVGVEIRNDCTIPCSVGPLISLGLAHDLVFDQVVCHGKEPTGGFPETQSTVSETYRCFGAGQSKNIMIVDSYFYDFYCIAGSIPGASGCDSQVIGFGTGQTQNTLWGNYKVVNNFGEAAESFTEGGGGAGPIITGQCSEDSPADMEWRLNHMYKPPQWMPPTQATAGSGYPVVKNGFELKNGVRAVVEANIVDGVWAGFSQNGYAFVINPKNQASGTTNLCPGCSIHDIIVRLNYVTRVAAFGQIANGRSDNGGLAFMGNHEAYYQNVTDNMMFGSDALGNGCYKCQSNNVFVLLSEAINMNIATDILHDIAIDHNTWVLASSTVASTSAVYGVSGAPQSTGFGVYNITLTNNLSVVGTAGTQNVVGGGSSNCAGNQAAGAPMLNSCFVPLTMGGNAMVANLNNITWPSGAGANCLTEPSYTSIFVTYNNGAGFNGGGANYAVKGTSACHNAAIGGTDPGANVTNVLAAIAGVA